MAQGKTLKISVDVDDAIAEIERLKKALDEVTPCPNCHYCPSCGRSNNPQPVPYYPGTWPYPYTITYR